MTYLYAGLLFTSIFINYFLISPIVWTTVSLKTIFILLFIILLAVVYFMLDFIVFNMIRNNVLLLDLPYILKGKLRFIPFIISFMISILEELLFRFYLLQESNPYLFVYLMIGSISFGLVHIAFSKYDLYSKMVLGLVCGVLLIVSKNILYPIVFHCVYNYFTFKDKGVSEIGHSNK